MVTNSTSANVSEKWSFCSDVFLRPKKGDFPGVVARLRDSRVLANKLISLILQKVTVSLFWLACRCDNAAKCALLSLK